MTGAVFLIKQLAQPSVFAAGISRVITETRWIQRSINFDRICIQISNYTGRDSRETPLLCTAAASAFWRFLVTTSVLRAPLNLQRNKRSFLGHALMQNGERAVIEFYIKWKRAYATDAKVYTACIQHIGCRILWSFINSLRAKYASDCYILSIWCSCAILPHDPW